MSRPSPEWKKAKKKSKNEKKVISQGGSYCQQLYKWNVIGETATCIGDVDIDHVEMQLCNCYRKQDGEGATKQRRP